MQLEFRTTAEDYLTFYKYYFFQRKLVLWVLVLGLFCLVIGSAFVQDQQVLSWTYVLVVLSMVLALAAVLFFIPYRRAVRRFWSVFEEGKSDQPRKIHLTADGFNLQWAGGGAGDGDGMEEKPVDPWRWERVRAVETNGSLVMILPFQGPVIIIPRSYFPSDSETGNFVGIIANGILKVRGSRVASDAEKARRLAYWGLLGFIPNVGVIAGLVLIIQGIFRYRSWRLIVIGAADILFTVVFWTVFTQWTMTSPTFTIPMKQFAKAQLNTVFKSVEFYKLQHGQYPDSLRQVEDIRGNVWITDPIIRKGMKTVNFYYEKTDDQYWLFSVGEDGEPFTADDIFPSMNLADSGKFGLRMR
jgi:hypothetical protein